MSLEDDSIQLESNTTAVRRGSVALAEYKAKVASGELIPVRRSLQEKFEEHPTPLKAIHLKCYECMGNVPTSRTDIKNCTSTACALHKFRPVKGDY